MSFDLPIVFKGTSASPFLNFISVFPSLLISSSNFSDKTFSYTPAPFYPPET